MMGVRVSIAGREVSILPGWGAGDIPCGLVGNSVRRLSRTRLGHRVWVRITDGWLASRIGARWPLGIGGIVCHD